jgi:hypothetical protein
MYIAFSSATKLNFHKFSCLIAQYTNFKALDTALTNETFFSFVGAMPTADELCDMRLRIGVAIRCCASLILQKCAYVFYINSDNNAYWTFVADVSIGLSITPNDASV